MNYYKVFLFFIKRICNYLTMIMFFTIINVNYIVINVTILILLFLKIVEECFSIIIVCSLFIIWKKKYLVFRN